MSDVFPYPVHRALLDNGLAVVTVPYDSPGIVAYWTIVRAGSRDEVEEGRSGFAHFFEHMMFRGTDRFSMAAYNDVLKGLGADTNAFTSDDLTAYHNLAPASALETLMTLESDRFLHLNYSEEDFKKEAGAVLGEYRKNASNPIQTMHEALRERAFTAHTYKHTTIGFLRDIEAMPGQYEYSRRFFDRFYRPENCILLVVGDADPAQVERMARRFYGSWARGSHATRVPAEPPQKESKRVELTWPSPTQPLLYAAYHAPAFTTETAGVAALDLVSQLLFSESAPLYQKLVVHDAIADVLTGGAEDHRDPYLFTWLARAKQEADLPRIEAEVTAALDLMTREPVPVERLKRARSHLRYAFAMHLDTPGAVARSLAHYLSLTGDPGTINRLYALYETVTPEQVRDAARRVFTPSGRTVVTLRAAAAPAPGAATASGAAAGGGAR